MIGVEAELEAATLGRWTDQSTLDDIAGMRDSLREALNRAQDGYREARSRGWRGQDDADRAAAEMVNLTVLLGVCAEELEWRRTLCIGQGRVWLLGDGLDVAAIERDLNAAREGQERELAEIERDWLYGELAGIEEASSD